MHHEHVMDTSTMMESGAITILMDTMMVTSPGNANFHVLFVYIYSSNHSNSQMTFLCHNFLSSPSTFTNEHFIMFLPPTSILNPVIYPFTDIFYPPPILVKHHVWFLPVADLFISLNGVLYGVHQSYFKQSPLFQEVLQYGRDKEIGINPCFSIPFNTLKKEIFNDFLHLLYFGAERLEYLNREEWYNIKQLSMDWHFPRLTAFII
jgi:hypothetical protein